MAFVMNRDYTKEIIVLLSAVFNSSILAYGAFNGRQMDGSPLEESHRAALLAKARI